MTIFHVVFGIHVPQPSVTSMASQLSSYGLMRRDPNTRKYAVNVQRAAKAETLRKQLHDWEQYGFLTWQTDEKEKD